jgi:hypothetical protein
LALYNFVAMKIEHYISQLLYRHQCVTVPGFGAFLTEMQSAHLHENTNSFYPPKKVVSFNSHLKNNDGLLANHISQIEKTTYENAVASIESEVVIWNSIIQVNERFTLKNIGELHMNSEKNLVFTPSENINYLKESFGLNSFVSPAVKRDQSKQIEEPSLKEEVFIAEEKEVIEFTPEVSKGRPYLKYAATPIPSVTLTVKEEKLLYHIVAGAFRNEENAQNIYTDLLKSGFKARRIAPNRHGLFPVLYGSYANYAEAQQAMLEIQKANNPDAWLMVKAL